MKIPIGLGASRNGCTAHAYASLKPMNHSAIMRRRYCLLMFIAILSAAPALSTAQGPFQDIFEATHLGSTGIIISSLALLVAVLGQFMEIRAKLKREKSAAYDHLDEAYQDLYSIAAQHPQVVDPRLTWNLDAMTDDQRLRYEAYVWKVWVICESIFDQTRMHDEVWQTWKTAIDIEARLHIVWILREVSIKPDSFKKQFRDWLCSEYGSPEKMRRLRTSALSRYATLRKAAQHDVDHIMELERMGFQRGVLESRETFEGRLRHFPSGFFVLLIPEETRPIGYICGEIWSELPARGDLDRITLDHAIGKWHDEHGEVLYISSQTVDPRFRGANLGEFMFRRMIETMFISHPQLKSAFLIVSESWHQARRIYERCGFQKIEELPAFFKPEGEKPQSAIVMTRSLPLGWGVCEGPK